ncbi:hypothetical protein [Aeromonas phage Akh-2]|nr:hypothetical protein [Aeromonas phage Akh-2]
MENAGVVVWFPALSMLAAMFIWWLVLFLLGKASKDSKKFIKEHSIVGWGWIVFAAIAIIFMVFKSVTSPVLRPVNEVAPKEVRTVLEAPELPVLKDVTGQAKPKDVLKEQPKTPMVDKAIEEAMKK